MHAPPPHILADFFLSLWLTLSQTERVDYAPHINKRVPPPRFSDLPTFGPVIYHVIILIDLV